MKLITTDIEGVYIIEPRLFEDERGYFFEVFSERKFTELTGIATRFVQDNESRSIRGVVRGLHFQLPPFAQSKLVRVVRGRILDVAVDIRRGSPTYGKHISVELSEHNHQMLFIPRGFAHGFSVLEGDAIVEYKCDNYYNPETEGAIRWNDPTLAIDWHIATNEAIVSAKDKANPLFEECSTLFDYNCDYYV